MKERRKYNWKDNSKYRETQKLKRRKIVDAKENYMKEQCKKIKEMVKKYEFQHTKKAKKG